MCEFCQTLEDIRWCHAKDTNPKIKHIQTVALLDESYKGRERRGRLTHFSDKFKLNFCPMCGRDLREDADESKTKGTD